MISPDLEHDPAPINASDDDDEDEQEPDQEPGDEDEEDEEDEAPSKQGTSAPATLNTLLSHSQILQMRLEEQFEVQRKNKIRRQREIYNRLNESQRARYVAFIQGAFKQTHVKKVMLPVLETSKVTEPLTIVMIAISKMFVGDLVELSLEIMNQWGHQGAIRPIHLREAYRRLYRRLGLNPPRRLFLR